MKRFLTCLLAVCVTTSLSLVADEGHQHGGPATEKVGSVKFPTSCSRAVQKDFERAVAMLHSFWYDATRKAFQEVADKDPDCAMAYWGVAMTLWHPLWAPPSPEELKEGAAAIEKARAAKRKNDRERDYIEALAAFYSDVDTRSHAERALAYEEAMKRVHERRPKDTEAEIFYALAIRANAPGSDKTYERQKRAGKMLERIFAKQPQHPGLAHYIIHCYDYPALAELGLDAARRYAKIAPSSPHALHMPSHIFIRLGLWEDAISSNIASADAAKADAKSRGSNEALGQALHAMDYLAYAYLQSGQETQVSELMTELEAMVAVNRGDFAAAYAWAAIPARYTVERRQWQDAAALPDPDNARFSKSYWNQVTDAITLWARAIGRVRSGQVEKARDDIASLESLHKRMTEANKLDGANEVEIFRLEAAAWAAFADGEKDRAVELLRNAADLEDRTDKHPVTPGAVLPAREQLGDMLVELGRPTEALTEYETSLKSAPKRFNSLYGAARAAEAAGDRAKAAEYYAALLEVAKNGNAEKAELQRAKEFVASLRASK